MFATVLTIDPKSPTHNLICAASTISIALILYDHEIKFVSNKTDLSVELSSNTQCCHYAKMIKICSKFPPQSFITLY